MGNRRIHGALEMSDPKKYQNRQSLNTDLPIIEISVANATDFVFLPSLNQTTIHKAAKKSNKQKITNLKEDSQTKTTVEIVFANGDCCKKIETHQLKPGKQAENGKATFLEGRGPAKH